MINMRSKRMANSFSMPISAAALMLAASSACAQTAADISLTRLDCGKTTTLPDVARFSDTAAFGALKIQLTFSCYLIKHGSEYLVWDTGNPAANPDKPLPTSPKASLIEQLALLKLTPAQITYVGISHYHGDHSGQVASFPHATLLIVKGYWDL